MKIHDPIAFFLFVVSAILLVLLVIGKDVSAHALRVVAIQMTAVVSVVIAGHAFGLFTTRGRD